MSDDTTHRHSGPEDTAKDKAAEKKRKLAEQLRANLRRRKTQSREIKGQD